MIATARTHNNANAHEHSQNHLLEFFSKAGSLMKKRESYYGNEQDPLDLFKLAWYSGDNYTCMQLLFYLRDIRGGCGNRSGFRSILSWLATQNAPWVKANIHFIPMVGRWDDLFSLYKTPCKNDALKLWSNALLSNNPSEYGLAAKWADRNDRILREYMNLSPKEFRKLVVSKSNVVETQMCSNQWDAINYNQVPSIASSRYSNAFSKHDEVRYGKWKKSLEDKNSGNKVNAGAIYPHDIIRMVHNSSEDNSLNSLAEAQLNSMPNFIKSGYRIMPILDFSGSMSVKVMGQVSAMDVSLGLGLYCSEKVGKDNPFYRKVIPFSERAKLVDWRNKTLVDAIYSIPDGYCGCTNIKSALSTILDAAKFFNASNDQIPNMLLIISDMQFDQGVSDKTPVKESIEEWVACGYNAPKIVYWNTAGYMNQPCLHTDENVAMVSGFSPSILKAVLNAEKFDPMSIMKEALKKYNVVRV